MHANMFRNLRHMVQHLNMIDSNIAGLIKRLHAYNERFSKEKYVSSIMKKKTR